MRLLARCAFLAILVTLAAAVRAQAPAPSMTPEELRAVYVEAVQTHDGFVYNAFLLGYPSEEAARKSWELMQQPRFRLQRMDRIYKNVTARNFYLFQLDPAVRDRIVNLENGRRTGPVNTARGWVIAELVSAAPAPAPAFEQLQPILPAIVAAGGLPSAGELLSNPALRMRTIANAIGTAEQLRAAPGDLDVNQKLSNTGTLLMRAIALGRTDLVEELLRRGANPNQCARKFCPLDSAIFGGSRPIVDLLLKAGADANQSDPAVGVPEGPLGTAAYKGDLELAGRLIAAGAKIDGQGRGETPLMAAAQAGSRPAVEFLLAKGADPFLLTSTAPARNALDAAAVAKNPAFSAWLRQTMRERAAKAGKHAWTGWIEQDGRRSALDGKPVVLKRAPFRIVVRMSPDQLMFASASDGARILEEFRKGDPESALFSTMNISAESDRDDALVVHAAADKGERWGGSQAWYRRDDKDTRFSEERQTPQGLELARDVRRLVLIEGDKVLDPVAIGEWKGASLYLVLGTRLHMTYMDDEVFGSRSVELRFR